MKYQSLIEEMTLEEKASLMSGKNFWNTKSIDRLGVPSIMLTDGPHGLRKQGGKADHLGLNKSMPATCFPTAATLANSWNKHLIYEVGKKIGKEAANEGVSVLLGPGMNIKRNPLCGRNFEYFSEDPYLTGTLASEMVNGIQSNGIAASPKHYAVNSQEHMRMTIDEIVDKRSLREIYLEAFRRVVETSDPKTIMTSYNKVNGAYANEHQHLMNDILYDEWKFDGVAVTDWGGNNDRVEGLKVGNQLEMPSTNGITDLEIINAVGNKQLDEAVLNEAVDRVLDLAFETTKSLGNIQATDYDNHHAYAIAAAQQSIVLLKNDDHTLPLDLAKKFAVIGDFAKNPRYQGAGSSLVNPTRVTNIVDIFQNGTDHYIGYAQGFKRMGGKSSKLLKEALALSEKVDTLVVCLGLDESSEAEGVDRKSLKLPQNQLTLIEELVKLNKNIVVVLSGGGAVELPFEQKVQSIVYTCLAGQGSAEATVNILTGQYNPNAKLSETFPIRYEDVPSSSYYPGLEATSEHREGLYIGYRYYDKVGKAVQYPFGHGLSYSTFEYSNLKVDGLTITLDVKNTSSLKGQEIVQLYVEKEDSKIFRAKKELKAYAKVTIEPEATVTITLEIEERDLMFYHTEEERWAMESGTYKLLVGSSLEDIRLAGKTVIESETFNNIYSEVEFPTYFSGQVHEIKDDEFNKLLGFTPPAPLWDRDRKLGMNDTVAQARFKGGIGKSVYGLLIFIKLVLEKVNRPLTANNVYFVLNMPFRQIERFTGGKISNDKVTAFLNKLNK